MTCRVGSDSAEVEEIKLLARGAYGEHVADIARHQQAYTTLEAVLVAEMDKLPATHVRNNSDRSRVRRRLSAVRNILANMQALQWALMLDESVP